jgi:hypothetical protein
MAPVGPYQGNNGSGYVRQNDKIYIDPATLTDANAATIIAHEIPHYIGRDGPGHLQGLANPIGQYCGM